MYVPPESRMKTSAWKQTARHVLLPPGLWAEQAFAAVSYAFKWRLLPPASSKVELCPLLLPLYTWKWLIYWGSCSGTVTITQAYKYNQCLASGFQSELGTSGMWTQISHGPDVSAGHVATGACPVLGYHTNTLPFLATRRGSGSPAQPAPHANFSPPKFRAKAQAKASLFLIRQQQIK